MSKIEKLLAKMRNNPQDDWNIEDIKILANKYGIEHRQPGTSHVTFRTQTGKKLTIPAHKPIKAVYIKLFMELITALGDQTNVSATV
jgi:predicted RNA binding protein YcfA (HicA-like mRNA interferase family)